MELGAPLLRSGECIPSGGTVCSLPHSQHPTWPFRCFWRFPQRRN